MSKKDTYHTNELLRKYMARKKIKPEHMNFYFWLPDKLLSKYLNNEVVVPLSLIVKLK